MVPRVSLQWWSAAIVGLGVLACLLPAGPLRQDSVPAASSAPSRQPTGYPQLISYQTVSATEGEMCQWAPVSAGGNLIAARQQRVAARSSLADVPIATEDLSQRQPVRMVRDPYPVYSAVSVDTVNDEVVLVDENLFSVMVYNRLANTPPTAKMTEPKRVMGGHRTRIEFNCALYVDPGNGDIYAVNNDSVDTLVIFDRQAKGDVPPTRELATPHRTFGIAVDEKAEEMYLAVQEPPAVVVYHKNAKDWEAPIRLLQGNQTQLADAHGIAIDTKNQLMYVSNYGNYRAFRPNAKPAKDRQGNRKPNWPASDMMPGTGANLPPSITVYPLKASGDTPPLRVIQGSNTQLNYPSLLTLDVERQELYVANDMGDSILTFSTSANGDAKPIRVLKGPKTQIKNPTGVYLDTKNDELWVASFGNHTAAVFKHGASGDVAPLRVIRSAPKEAPGLGLGNPHSVAYDSKREEFLVPN